MNRTLARHRRSSVASIIAVLAVGWTGSESVAQPTPSGPPFEVTDNIGVSALPDVAISRDGRFLVAWQTDGYTSSVRGQRYDRNGRQLGRTLLLGGNGVGVRDGNLPSLGMTPSGTFVVAWLARDYYYRTDVRAQRFDADGRPRERSFPVTDAINDSFNVASLSLAVDPEENFVVVWPDLDGEVSGQRFDASGARLGMEFRVNTETARTQLHPSVAMDAQGGFLVTWDSSVPGARYLGVFAQRYDAFGTPLSGEFQVHTGSGDGHGYPVAAVAPDGSAVVVWHGDEVRRRRDILGQLFDSAGRRRGGQFVVNERTDGDQSLPAVAMGVDGGFLVAWQNGGNGNAPEGVRGQFFDASGARLGAELDVSMSNAGAPSNAAVAIGVDGSALVVWQTTSAFGGHPAVFARRYVGGGEGGDGDGDGVLDRVDNCPTVSNADQADVGGDGYGDACVAPDVIVPADARLGAHPRIGAGTIIEPEVTIGDDAMIGEDVRLGRGLRAGDRLTLADFASTGRRSTLGNDVTIGFASRLEGNVIVGDSVSIADQVVVRRGVTIEDHATVHPLVVLFAGARIGAGAVIEMGVRIGRGAVVAPGAVVPAGTTVPPGATVP